MREDMKDILSEGNMGKKGKENLRSNRRKAKLDPENADQITSMRKLHIQGHNYRHSNERSGPMTRFLRSRVGQPWNKVYSEICQELPLGNDRARHFRDEVDYRVETNIKMKNGVPHEFCGYSWRNDRDEDGFLPLTSYSQRWPHFYVNPNNGLLCEAPVGNRYRWRSNQTEDQNLIKDPAKPLSRYLTIDGIWYEIGFRRPTQVEKEKRDWGSWHEFYDAVNARTKKVWHNSRSPLTQHNISKDRKPGRTDWTSMLFFSWRDTVRHYGEPLFPMTKRQISSQEIRRIKSLTAQKKAA